MKVKSYEVNETKIVMNKHKNRYVVSRISKNYKSNIYQCWSYEDANEVFDFFLDMELGVDK